jgi:hypothetical protein
MAEPIVRELMRADHVDPAAAASSSGRALFTINWINLTP